MCSGGINALAIEEDLQADPINHSPIMMIILQYRNHVIIKGDVIAVIEIFFSEMAA